MIPVEIELEGTDESIKTEHDKKENIRGLVKEIIKEDLGELSPEKEGGTGDLSTLFSWVRNPRSLLFTIAPYFAAIFSIPTVGQAIVDELTKPGGLIDVRFKRIVEREVNAFLDRQTQANTQLGLRQVIITSEAGFRNLGGQGQSNTFKFIREAGGINRFAPAPTIREKALGAYWKGV